MDRVRATTRAGHVSDSFGASTIGYTDGNGNGVTVRVTGWESSSNDTVGSLQRKKAANVIARFNTQAF